MRRRIVTRAHVIAWRDRLVGQGKVDASVQRLLSALSSLFDVLCNANAVTQRWSSAVLDIGGRMCECRRS